MHTHFPPTHQGIVAVVPTQNSICTWAVEALFAATIQIRSNESTSTPDAGFSQISCLNCMNCGDRFYHVMSGHKMNKWFAANAHKYRFIGDGEDCRESYLHEVPTLQPAVKRFADDNHEAIAIFNDNDPDDPNYKPTLHKVNRFWGHVVGSKNVREQLGLYDPESIGIAEKDHTFKNGDTVSAGDYYAKMSQRQHATGTGFASASAIQKCRENKDANWKQTQPQWLHNANASSKKCSTVDSIPTQQLRVLVKKNKENAERKALRLLFKCERA